MSNFCLMGEKALVNTSSEFYSTDSEELFNANKITIPHWVWKYSNVGYTWNELGYRTKPFDKINYDNYGIITGCSNTVGVGVPQEKTFAGLVESNLNVDVMNIAKAGSSNDFIFYNLMHVLGNVRTTPPKFIVINWTFINRMLWFKKTRDIEWLFHWTPHTAGWPTKDTVHATVENKISEMHVMLDNDHHMKTKFEYYRKTIRLIASLANIRLVEFTYDPMQQNNMQFIANNASDINLRFGRDMQSYNKSNPSKSHAHPGIYQHQETFDYIKLCLK